MAAPLVKLVIGRVYAELVLYLFSSKSVLRWSDEISAGSHPHLEFLVFVGLLFVCAQAGWEFRPKASVGHAPKSGRVPINP